MLCSLVHGRGVPGRAAGAAVPVVLCLALPQQVTENGRVCSSIPPMGTIAHRENAPATAKRTNKMTNKKKSNPHAGVHGRLACQGFPKGAGCLAGAKVLPAPRARTGRRRGYSEFLQQAGLLFMSALVHGTAPRAFTGLQLGEL